MKPPIKTIYSNDITNLITCVSPYHRKGESFRREMLEASVDEVSGTGRRTDPPARFRLVPHVAE